MSKIKWFVIIAIPVIVVLAGLIYLRYFRSIPKSAESIESPVQTSIQEKKVSQSSTKKATQNTLVFPIADFKNRITKKPFGIYITPQTSPVQPEKFTGYHTGVDVEYTDVSSDVPVYAVYNGKVVYANYVSGYGGVIIISFQYQNKNYLALYGHLRLGSLVGLGTSVKRGEKIGVLGTGYTQETSGERKHLHFGIILGSTINLRGYVQTKTALSGWVNPLLFY